DAGTRAVRRAPEDARAGRGGVRCLRRPLRSAARGAAPAARAAGLEGAGTRARRGPRVRGRRLPRSARLARGDAGAAPGGGELRRRMAPRGRAAGGVRHAHPRVRRPRRVRRTRGRRPDAQWGAPCGCRRRAPGDGRAADAAGWRTARRASLRNTTPHHRQPRRPGSGPDGLLRDPRRARARRRLAFTGEVGLGILGTRASDAEQSDVLLYAAGAEYRAGPITLAALLLGQADGQRDRTFRGNEDLRELRFSVRA